MEQYDETGKVICILCGHAFHQITPQHLKKEHDISIEDFKIKYPDVSLTGLSFRAKQKYKYANVFDQEVVKNISPEIKIEEREEFDLDRIPSISQGFRESVTNFIEEVDSLTNITKSFPNPKNNIHREKLKILNFLLKFFPDDLQNSYFIEKRSIENYLEFRLVTDICIPSKKIVFEFPNTFWHNRDMPLFNKYIMLRNNGWKVFEFPGVLPTEQEIKSALIKFNLI